MSFITFCINCVLLIVVVRCDDFTDVDIIDIPAKMTRDFSASPTHFYFKYQTPSHFNVSVSDIYIQVPGLKTVFNVAQPTPFEITYQGSCEVHKDKGVHIKLLVDNHLIVGDRRTPNVPQRHLLANPIAGGTIRFKWTSIDNLSLVRGLTMWNQTSSENSG